MIKLIGIGNDCRGDDYVGLYIIGKLQEILPSQSTVDLLVFNNRDTSELFELWEPTDKIYMFDAIQADDTVGKIVKIDLNQMNLPEEISRTSSHTLNMKEIVELTKLMKGSPQQWLFWGIVGQFFGHVEKKLSADVLNSANQVVKEIAARLLKLRE